MAQPRRHKKRQGNKTPVKTAITGESRIASIGARGDGVAVIDGEKVFVPLTAPGDEVRLSFRGGRGEIDALIEPSDYRAEPPCLYYGACGGCALQHVNEKFYRSWKRQLVVDALARAGFGDVEIAPLVACGADTRRRASFAVRKTAAGVVFGFNERASARIIDIKQCLVLAPRLQNALALVRSLAMATPLRWRAFDCNVTLCENGLDVLFTGGDAADDLSGQENLKLADAAREGDVCRVTVDGAAIASFEPPVVSFGGVPVAVPPGSFLQASEEGERALAAFVVEHAKGAKYVADLFSGSGTFTLPLAGSAAVDAFDSDAPAMAALDAAARAAGLRHPVRAGLRNLFERPLSAEDLKPYDAVVFDPPRAGARAQAEQLAQSAVRRVIGVSCNPASFARDAAILQGGGYSLSQALPVDQFVYSPHVELVGIFTRT